MYHMGVTIIHYYIIKILSLFLFFLNYYIARLLLNVSIKIP